MSSGASKPNPLFQSAAWRISLWATLAFAVGTLLVFAMLHRFVANDIQRRSDTWLSGEAGVLGDVANRTPKDRLYSRVVREVAELASREVPNKIPGSPAENDAVFFLQAGTDGTLKLWAGSGDGSAQLKAIRSTPTVMESPYDLKVDGLRTPYRVAAVRMDDGSSIYLGLSEKDEIRVLRSLRTRFMEWWLLIVLLGFATVFYATRRMLGHVREITEAASRIGQSDLSSRVPASDRNDEVGHLGRTLNRMLDRIEISVHQLHSITDSLAHDLRSPLTAIRGKLEMALTVGVRGEQIEPIVSAMDELDRLTEVLNTSLDVAEAKADALRLNRTVVDLDELLRVMIDLYEPCMADKGISVQLRSAAPAHVLADAALLHRVIANLLDNEVKHLPSACTVALSIRMADGFAKLVIQDNGPGFGDEIDQQMFEQRTKGKNSKGHGLGLAFVAAVVRAHGGEVAAGNGTDGGALLWLTLPLANSATADSPTNLALAHG